MVTTSSLALRLWKLLTERPHSLTIEEAKRDLGASKSAIARAILELEEAGLIQISEE